MNRVAAASPAFTQGTGLWGADAWGTLAIILLAAACVALGAAIYMLMKSGRGPYLGRKKSRQKHRQR